MRLRGLGSWRSRLIAIMLAFAVVPAAGVGLLAFGTFEDSTRRATLRSLEGIARAKAEAVDQFIETRRKDVERMAGVLEPYLSALETARTEAAKKPAPTEPQPPAPQPLEDGQKQPPRDTGPTGTGPEPARPDPETMSPQQRAVHSADARLREVLALLLGDQGTFEELLVIRADGLVAASTFGAHEDKTAAEVEYFKRGRGATYVQPPFVSPITQQLTMVIATPMRDQDSRDVGVLAARLNLQSFFRLLHDYTGLGNSGETVVGKRIGDKVLFMAPTRHDDKAALRDVVSGQSLRRAMSSETGAGSAIDYRGVEVLAAWRPVPSLDWGLVTKIDRSEALAELRQTRFKLLVITALVILLAIGVSLLAATSIIRPLRQLRVAADRISKGDLAVEIDIDTHDEIGELADSFERMVAAIKFFREQSHGAVSDEDASLSDGGDATAGGETADETAGDETAGDGPSHDETP